MEKRDKIIIAGLVIVIIALLACLAYMFMGNNMSAGDGAPDGMKIYDFNSEFKMAVPKDVRFLKEWNNSGDVIFGMGYSYFDKNNEISVVYANSPMITHELVDNIIDVGNSSGNATIEFDGDMVIAHNVKNNGKVGNSEGECNFTDTVFLQKGHTVVVVSGNDLDLIKSMAKTIEFYE